MTTQLETDQRPGGQPTETASATKTKRIPRIGAREFVYLGYLIVAVIMMAQLLADPAWRHHSDNPGDDQVLFEWMLGHTAHAITHLENPLFSDMLNHPWGVNLMANTSVIAIGVVMTPLTLICGAPFSYAIAMTLGLFGTAVGWFRVLNNQLELSIMASTVGGAICAFGPATMAHANGHLNFTALICIPLIIGAILRLREAGRTIKTGIQLGVLLAIQVFTGEEAVFLIALFMAVFSLLYAIMDYRTVKALALRYLKGLSIAGAVSLAIVAYPLSVQFFGKQSYKGIPWLADSFVTDVKSLIAFPTNSLGGQLTASNDALRHNITEENTFYGVPLLLLVLCLAIGFAKHHKALRALIITACSFGLVSLGSNITSGGQQTGTPGPYKLLRELPLFDSTIPTRFALPLLPVIAILIAYAIHQTRTMDIRLKTVSLVAIGLALLPIIPTPPQTAQRPAVPQFITSGAWREHVSQGGTLVPVPMPDGPYDGQRWQEAADYNFAIPLGAFIGPNEDGEGQWSGPQLAIANLISNTEDTGQLPPLSKTDKALVAADLRSWQAEAIVLGPTPHRETVDELLTTLLGPGKVDGDATVWDIDPKTGEVR